MHIPARAYIDTDPVFTQIGGQLAKTPQANAYPSAQVRDVGLITNAILLQFFSPLRLEFSRGTSIAVVCRCRCIWQCIRLSGGNTNASALSWLPSGVKPAPPRENLTSGPGDHSCHATALSSGKVSLTRSL